MTVKRRVASFSAKCPPKEAGSIVSFIGDSIMQPNRRSFLRTRGTHLLTLVAAAGWVPTCSSDANSSDPGVVLREQTDNVAAEDGLAVAYANFTQQFTSMNFNHQFPIGAGYHPGLSTEKVTDSKGNPALCKITIDRDANTVNSRLE